MKLNLFRLALKNIGSRRTRSWLTILGVLVGVTAVVALLSIGTGVQEAVLQQFEDIGYDIILIAPANMAGAARSSAGGFVPGSGAGRAGGGMPHPFEDEQGGYGGQADNEKEYRHQAIVNP